MYYLTFIPHYGQSFQVMMLLSSSELCSRLRCAKRRSREGNSLLQSKSRGFGVCTGGSTAEIPCKAHMKIAVLEIHGNFEQQQMISTHSWGFVTFAIDFDVSNCSGVVDTGNNDNQWLSR